jgi:hypothetical protein
MCVALVDSGSEHTLASPALARALNFNVEDGVQGNIGIGGGFRPVAFTTVHLELYKEVFRSGQTPLSEWDAEVGFLRSWEPPWAVLLGQVGFFDQFTVTLHRSAHALVVENWQAFDDRFGVIIEEADTSQPRFKP